MNNIINSLRETYNLKDDSIAELTSGFTRIELPKRHVFIENGKVNPNCYFIEQGITRSFVVLDGAEITHWFSKEGDITFAMHSFYNNEPAFEFVETLEPCVLYSIPTETLETLYKTNIDIANWARVLHQNAYQKMQLRHISRLYEDARCRYNRALIEYPYLFERVNLGYIASFLGISQVTLSKLRGGY